MVNNMVLMLLGLIRCMKVWLWVLVKLILRKVKIILLNIVRVGLIKENFFGMGSRKMGVSMRLVINKLIIKFIVLVRIVLMGVC